MDDRSPAVTRDAFYCPSSKCGVYARQIWSRPVAFEPGEQGATEMEGFSTSRCTACGTFAVWLGDLLIYPLGRRGQEPNPDMPEDVRLVYEEARAVARISAKSAAGLLRLGLQMLIDELEPGKESIDKKIGHLVARGLDPQVQRAMDILRVAGNESVHPGTMDLDADPDLLAALFDLINLIVDQVITRPKNIGELFDRIPEAKRKAIERRDQPRPPDSGP